ncbi:hypothetical protein Q8W71_00935 [Methylobacterium sp. NEAU 140]|uniref:hypothetical protein n=1 Tax=Methylobacterium sp. NEAU 140 TaxID=3064945 RepID=UPI002737149E|nr:hypothetical protein [Methylobacterium sp. NEAU 140]MDP4021174.1 hypothetical protein [Methylobacterium sp. NEAU 140]
MGPIARFSREQVLDLLRARVEAAGSASAAARSLGVSPSYLIDVRERRRPPGARLLAGLGLEQAIIPMEAARA